MNHAERALFLCSALAVSLNLISVDATAAEEGKRQVPQNAIYIGNGQQQPVEILLLPDRYTYTLRPRENQSFACSPIVDAVTFSGSKAAFKVECGKQYAVMGHTDELELREVTTDSR